MRSDLRQMANSVLIDFLRAERARLIERWQARVVEILEAADVSRIELLDHMPDFVDELLVVLEEYVHEAPPVSWSATRNAPAHGRQRLRVGFDVDEVVREYGILADVILHALTKAALAFDPTELRVLLHRINVGAAEAVNAYSRRRDDEQKRQDARHRGFIAHELRTPIGGALAALGVLVHTVPEVETSRPGTVLRRNLTELSELVDQVLIAGTLDAGVEPDYADVDVAATVRDVEERLAYEAGPRRLRLVVHAPDTLSVRADARLLRSAIVNVLRNAVKFSRPDSEVVVHVRREREDVIVEVLDGCGGLPAEGWTEMFEPFTQAGTNRAGFGLGLAIAKQAVEVHGGTIGVRNRPPTGCVFELRVPAAPPSAS
jgi:signal transduction histidine kinase